ncbi:MAG: hypothetical protein K2N23_06105 [Clostridia bacterium]|nr:hypothetical protein [Clostridia bacterium]
MERLKTILITVLTLMLLALGVITDGYYSAQASTLDTRQAIYEQRNVMDDLEGSTVNGKKFDLSDYPYSAGGSPQVISFIEFCYSSVYEKQSYFGLYIYVYNPARTAFNLTSEKNCIQIRTGGDQSSSFSNNYKLKYLNSGAEGLFLKFKIDLTSVQKQGILSRVKSSERVYEVSGFQLMLDKEVEEYSVGVTYRYSGYAEGCAPTAEQDCTLTYITDELEKCLSLDVRSTAYRPEGTNGSAYRQDTLHSVYFSVPNEIIEECGEMTKVHAKWLNAYTAPMLITGDKEDYNYFYDRIGKEASGKYGFHTNQDGRFWGGFYFVKYSHGYNYADNVENIISNLRYVFYAESGSADNYTVPAEELVGNRKRGEKGWFETYTERFSSDSTELVDERFDSVLFEKVDDEYTEKTISADDDDFKLTGVKYSSKTLWQKLYGLSADVAFTKEYSICPIQEVTVDDIKRINDKTAFCNEFYIHEIDYDKFCDYVTEADERDETVYLFRYMQSEYFSAEQVVCELKQGLIRPIDGGIPIWGTYWAERNTNAFVCQTWVQLGFDIIDVTFKLKDVETVIPVVMSPIDIAPPLDHPVITTPDFEFWRYGVAIIGALLGAVIVTVIIDKGVEKE